MIMTWTMLAPLAALASCVPGTVRDVRQWRADEIDFADFCREIAANGLFVSLGAGAALSPFTAGLFLVGTAYVAGDKVLKLRAGSREKLPPPRDPTSDSG